MTARALAPLLAAAALATLARPTTAAPGPKLGLATDIADLPAKLDVPGCLARAKHALAAGGFTPVPQAQSYFGARPNAVASIECLAPRGADAAFVSLAYLGDPDDRAKLEAQLVAALQ